MQINRLFEMIYLLLNKENITARALAEHFEVSARTIYRDVELLSSAGIPVYMTKGKGGGISLLPNFVLNKTVLTDDEKSSILSALNAVEAVSLEQTNTAVKKLSSLFGNKNADWIEVDFSGWANADEEANLFGLLKSAIIEKKKVRFDYHSTEGSMSRVVEPLKLCFKGQSWYLYAFCDVRSDYRFFKLRRIKEIMLVDESFERDTPEKIFTENEVFHDEFVTITLKVSKKMAYRVYDEFFEYEVLPSGDFVAKITMPRGEWVFQYLTTFGEYCEVLEPAEIRNEIKDKLEKAFKQYL